MRLKRGGGAPLWIRNSGYSATIGFARMKLIKVFKKDKELNTLCKRHGIMYSKECDLCIREANVDKSFDYGREMRENDKAIANEQKEIDLHQYEEPRKPLVSRWGRRKFMVQE